VIKENRLEIWVLQAAFDSWLVSDDFTGFPQNSTLGLPI